MDFYSEEGAEHNGHRLHWSGSGHETFKDWANERLDEKHAELQAGQVDPPTQTYNPALPDQVDLQRSDIPTGGMGDTGSGGQPSPLNTDLTEGKPTEGAPSA